MPQIPPTLTSTWRLVTVFALVALAAPAGADAHLRSSVTAVDYRASVVSPSDVVNARVYQSDRALSVTAGPGHSVVILGYLGEPFARIAEGRVTVNAASLTAAGLGLLKGSRIGTGWRLRSRGSTFVWHDRRLSRLPPGVDRKTWTIPLRVDGRSTQLTGQLIRVERPPVWPWILLGLPFVVATAFSVCAPPDAGLRCGGGLRPDSVDRNARHSSGLCPRFLFLGRKVGRGGE